MLIYILSKFQPWLRKILGKFNAYPKQISSIPYPYERLAIILLLPSSAPAPTSAKLGLDSLIIRTVGIHMFNVSDPDLFLTFIVPDFSRTFSWLVYYFLQFALYFFMSCSLVVHDLHMSYSWHVHDSFLTCSWLVHDLLMICSWLVHDLFMPCSCLVHELFMTFSWLVHALFMTCSWLAHCSWFDHYLVVSTCSQHIHDLFMTCL